MIGVEADLGGKIKGYGKSGGPLGEQITVAGIRFDSRAEAGVLAHGPKPAAILVGMNSTRERVLPGETQIALVVPFGQVVWLIHRLLPY